MIYGRIAPEIVNSAVEQINLHPIAAKPGSGGHLLSRFAVSSRIHQGYEKSGIDLKFQIRLFYGSSSCTPCLNLHSACWTRRRCQAAANIVRKQA